MTKEQIRRLRDDLGMTQQQFGELLGYAPSTARTIACRLESGKWTPPGVLARLLEYVRREADRKSK